MTPEEINAAVATETSVEQYTLNCLWWIATTAIENGADPKAALEQIAHVCSIGDPARRHKVAFELSNATKGAKTK